MGNMDYKLGQVTTPATLYTATLWESPAILFLVGCLSLLYWCLLMCLSLSYQVSIDVLVSLLPGVYPLGLARQQHHAPEGGRVG